MNNYKHSFRQLVVWKESKNITIFIYKITKQLPPEEKYGLTSQLRRASSSIMANIAEGNERKTRKDCLRFLEIARGSLVEVDSFIDLALELKYLSTSTYDICIEMINKTAYLLDKFEQSQINNPKRQ